VKHKADISTIIDKIKRVLRYEYPKTKKVLDKHVALLLGMSPAKLATHKSRGTIPYEEINDFCRGYNLSINSMLYGDGPALRLQEKFNPLFAIMVTMNEDAERCVPLREYMRSKGMSIDKDCNMFFEGEPTGTGELANRVAEEFILKYGDFFPNIRDIRVIEMELKSVTFFDD